jgi:hypothetical protein
MRNSAVGFSFSALIVLGMFLNVASQTPPKSMRASEVIALQAGGVLPEKNKQSQRRRTGVSAPHTNTGW